MTFSEARQTAVLSFTQIRKLRFPIAGKESSDPGYRRPIGYRGAGNSCACASDRRWLSASLTLSVGAQSRAGFRMAGSDCLRKKKRILKKYRRQLPGKLFRRFTLEPKEKGLAWQKRGTSDARPRRKTCQTRRNERPVNGSRGVAKCLRLRLNTFLGAYSQQTSAIRKESEWPPHPDRCFPHWSQHTTTPSEPSPNEQHLHGFSV